MSDWIWTLAPVAAVVYFAVNPHQFGELLSWAGYFVH